MTSRIPSISDASSRSPSQGSMDHAPGFQPSGERLPGLASNISKGIARKRQNGVALILTLTVLVAITILVVGFLSLVSTERTASSGYADNNRTRQFSETAVNMVIGQIRQATESTSGNATTWASQPGMIRVYGSSGSGGFAPLLRAHKLYSSGVMVTTSFGKSEADSEVPAPDWSSKPALYTDLNEPAHSAAGALRYPILQPPTTVEVPSFQIVGAPATPTQPVPMPVKWIYVLRDGTYAAATPVASSSSTVTIAGATAANPVVGRIAFWTDDETSKVNINTASEGVFWDIPRANSMAERRLASYLPVKNEFQRYPGHPATVSLSAVLGGFLTNTTGDASQGVSQYGLYYDLTPRVRTGGSLDGTRAPASSVIITKDADRLYASVDEYFFKEKATTTSTSRVPNDPLLTAEMLAKTQFFLTAHSRAPEVTLFNTPRIGLWPLQEVQTSGVTARNAYDKLIAFCTSLGLDKSLPASYPAGHTKGYAYHFQRKLPYRAGGTAPAAPSYQSSTADYTGIARNQVLYAYLQRLSGAAIPGFGGSFLTKYPNDRDQILTESFDYIRSLVNAIPTPAANLDPYYSYSPHDLNFGAVSPIAITTGGKKTIGSGRSATVSQVALLFYPTHIDTTDPNNVKTLKMRARVFVQPYCLTPGSAPVNAKYFLRMSSGVLNSSAGPLNLRSGKGLNLEYRDGFYMPGDTPKANKTALPSPAGQFVAMYYPPGGGASWQARVDGAGPYDYHYVFDAWESTTDMDVSAVTGGTFEFKGGDVNIDLMPASSDWDPAVQNLQFYFPPATIPVPKFEPQDLANITAGRRDLQVVSGKPKEYTLKYRDRFDKNLVPAGSKINVTRVLLDNMIYPGDSVHALTINPASRVRGDMRLVAFRPQLRRGTGTGGGNDERDYFSVHSSQRGGSFRIGTFDPAKIAAGQQFRKTWANYYNNQDSSGGLIPGLAYPEDAMPMVPAGGAGALNQFNELGDWDTGFDLQEDGPYINKPDEGVGSLLVVGASGNDKWASYFSRGYDVGYQLGQFSQASEADNVTYSPNRQIASAVMFGSLPTGVYGKTPGKPEPWQTLLFNPHPAAGSTATAHYGFSFPKDHLWLDLFWMPVVDPYAISEPFSTAGKINMNYEIMPFRYLKRRSGIEAVLKGTKMMAIPDSEVASYKKQPLSNATNNATTANYRLDINSDSVTGTLKGFEQRFAAGDLFRSASEICTISLVPKTSGATSPSYSAATYDTMDAWWRDNRLTGDNLRESPYNQLYPRLTTKSNTYTVHMRVQTLKKARSTNAGEWDDSRDLIQGEYRGSALIERFIDPNDPGLPDFTSSADNNANATPDNQETMDPYYRFRVIQRRQFTP